MKNSQQNNKFHLGCPSSYKGLEIELESQRIPYPNKSKRSTFDSEQGENYVKSKEITFLLFEQGLPKGIVPWCVTAIFSAKKLVKIKN